MRLLLVEFFPTALRRNERSMLFPFLKGLAQRHGVETRWICFGGDAELRSSSGRLADDAESFATHLDGFAPSHLASSAPLPEAMAAHLASRESPPRVVVLPSIGDVREFEDRELLSGDPRSRKFFARCGWFLDWLSAADPACDDQYLVDDVAPDYGALMANEAARVSRAHITIAGGVLCGNKRILRKNPLFRDIGLPSPSPASRGSLQEKYYGCSFCGSDRISLSRPGTDPLASIERQLHAALETAGPNGRNKGIFEFYDIRAFWSFDEVFEIVLRLKMPPAVFLFNPRVDDVLRVHEKIDRVLPAISKAGHEVRMLSMGIENFSPREQARFNKGITVEQVDQLLALVDRWGKTFPRAINPFKGGHDKVELGFILFTPWTTLEDVRLNLEHAAARNFSSHGFWLHSTLLMRPSMPLHYLAQADGEVLADSFPDKGQLYGIYRNEGDPSSLASWRFKDARVADYFALLVRVCASDTEGSQCAFFAGDPDFALASRLYAEANQGLQTSPLAIALALLEVFEQAQPPWDRAALLREGVERAITRTRGPVSATTAGAGAQSRQLVNDAGPSLEARVVQHVVDRIRHVKPEALADVAFDSVEEVVLPDWRCVRIGLSIAGRALSIDLLDPSSAEPCFVRSRHFRAVYRSDTPVTSARERDCLTLLLRSIDVQMDRAREAEGAAT